MIANTIYRNGNGMVPLVLIHGFPVDHRMWDDCAQAMLNQASTGLQTPVFPIIAPDMPGAGVSPIPQESLVQIDTDGAYSDGLDFVAREYVQLLHSLGYQRAVWAGLSMGGYVALNIQRLFPQTVAGLALCDTKAEADSLQARADRLQIAALCEERQSVEPVMHFAQSTTQDSSIKQTQVFQDRFARWIREQQPEGIAWRERMAAGRVDLTQVLSQITVPLLLVSGVLDPSSPPTAMQSIADRASCATTILHCFIEDCGHFSATEHPLIVAGALQKLMSIVLE